MTKNIFLLLRVKDWLKNIVIFFPILFSSQLFNTFHYANLLIGFLSFSILSSFVYILNDIIDVKNDKNHPLKRLQKPLANGMIQFRTAYILIIFLFLTTLIFIYFFPILRLSLLFYLFLSLIYNFGIKKIPYLEIIILSLGYVVRTDCGSRIISVESSTLMLIAVFSIGIFFILLKRFSELNLNIDLVNRPTRNVLNYYNKNTINFFTVISLIVLSIVFIIYIFFVNYLLIICFLLIIFFLLRYFLLVKDTHNAENPISFILSNKLLLIIALLVLFSSLIIYL